MKKFITIFALLMATTNIFALTFKQDGIEYSVTSSTDPMTVKVKVEFIKKKQIQVKNYVSQVLVRKLLKKKKSLLKHLI